MTTTMHTIAAEIAPKIVTDPIMQAAALKGEAAYAAALETELPRILEAHRVEMQHAFNVAAEIAHREPRRFARAIAPTVRTRILPA